MKVFLISPVRLSSDEINARISAYVKQLEVTGAQVHWPIRDTKQDDPTGGLTICRTNCQAILDADEIHIWYDETSNGSKFDMGAVFMLVEMLGAKKKVVIANENEVIDNTQKSFFKVFKRLANNQGGKMSKRKKVKKSQFDAIKLANRIAKEEVRDIERIFYDTPKRKRSKKRKKAAAQPFDAIKLANRIAEAETRDIERIFYQSRKKDKRKNKQ